MPENWGTITGSNSGWTLAPTKGERAAEAPGGLITTRAQQIKAGWVGQIIVDKTIVWESPTPFPEGQQAIESANAKVVSAVKGLFA